MVAATALFGSCRSLPAWGYRLTRTGYFQMTILKLDQPALEEET